MFFTKKHKKVIFTVSIRTLPILTYIRTYVKFITIIKKLFIRLSTKYHDILSVAVSRTLSINQKNVTYILLKNIIMEK